MQAHEAWRPRLYVEAALAEGARLALPAAAAHHATHVLRLRPGEALVLFDGQGGEYEARLAGTSRAGVEVEVLAHRPVERESPLRIVLVQGVSAGAKMDATVRHAVELGVAAIQPVFCERSLVRLADERARARAAHWRRVAIAACEQCGRNRVPEVRDPLPLALYCRRPDEVGLRLQLSPRAKRRLRELPAQAYVLAVGPEAGFTSAEESALEAAGFVPARLGPRVLRTETAALAAIAALEALYGESG